MAAQIATFGTLPDGREVERIRLAGGGLTADILTHGARVQDLRMEGVDHPLVLGAPGLEPYLGEMRYFGAIVGRFANRIAGGAFAIDGRAFRADRNFLGRHCLHGGALGAGQRLWRVADLQGDGIALQLELPDGQMGFPGTVQVEARYRLAGGALEAGIVARADAPTPCSFAHHGLFVLDGAGDVAGHELRIAAESYLPVDDELIPTGEVAPVAGTPFDFREMRAIGGHGYDHNFCLAAGPAPLRPVAWLKSPRSGLAMEVRTDAPGLQVYDGGQISLLPGHDGRVYGKRAGIALETQCWPDTPNRPAFPPSILRPGETYRHRASYAFGRRST